MTHSPGTQSPQVLVLGAGPAGLTAAYELSNSQVGSVILEKDPAVGGLARTFEHNGYLFDIGGHRFHSKLAVVNRIWREVLGDDLLTRQRLSRIYYRGRFFQYPLEAMNVVRGLGLWEVARCGASYLRSRISPLRPADNFESWVSNRFGRRLFEIFFRTYTEKVWGIPCKQIHSDWASQRIRGLSLSTVAREAIRGLIGAAPGKKLRSLIHEFQYPRLGPGMMWSRMQSLLADRGCPTVLESPIEKIYWEPGRVTKVLAGGRTYEAQHFISSIPIRELIERLDPAPPEYLRAAAADFHYRDFLTVALIVRCANVFPDNWIYVHDPSVAVGRIQNYKNWSPEMCPDQNMTGLGLEYFCFEGDGLWNASDDELIARDRREVAQLGLAQEDSIVDAKVLRVRKAYPIYDESYQRGVRAIRQFLDGIGNLQLIGRNGMHRYDNQDHAMLTGILAARNILGARYNLWDLCVGDGHHEEGDEITDGDLEALEADQPLMPSLTPSATNLDLLQS